MNVLLTNPNYKHTWALAQKFFEEGHDVYCLSGSRFCLLAFSRFIKKIILVQNLSSSSFDSICLKFSIDLVVPIGFKENLLLSQFKTLSKFEQRITVSDVDLIKSVSDKNNVLNILKGVTGFKIPESFVLDNKILSNPKLFDKRSFFIKPSREGSVKKYFKIQTFRDLLSSLDYYFSIG